MKTRYAFGIPIAVSLALGGAGAAAYAAASGQSHNCHGTQPAYTAPVTSQVPLWAGTWTLDLDNGRSTILPDGDTATCRNGKFVVS